MTSEFVQLKILESYTRDVGRGVVRVDYATMDELGIVTGDYVEVEGKKKTPAKILPLYPSDEDKGIIRADGLVRNNCGSDVGNLVKIKKIKVEILEEYTVIPLQEIPDIDEKYLSDALEAVCIHVGDNVIVPYFGGRLSFKVLLTKPEGYVVIQQNSKCTIGKELVNEDIVKLRKSIDEAYKIIITECYEQIKKGGHDWVIKNYEGKNKELVELKAVKAFINIIIKDATRLGVETD